MKQQLISYILMGTATVGALGVGYEARQGLLAGSTSAVSGPNADIEASAPPPVEQPRIDVVFALDTTGSMGGLLEGAKQKIWAIANRIASGQPRPDVRFGLVGYRDRGDAYVTRVTSLTRDIDGIHQALLGFRPAGGGDGPEDVNAALAAAIDQQPWEDGPKVLKLIFLVGDAPPHDDYDGPKSGELAALAKEKGIIVNAIRCGSNRVTERAWKQIARNAGGEYHTISQNGGVVVEKTPFDEELAKLNRDLVGTVIPYGSQKDRVRSRKKMATREALGTYAGASAAAFNAKSDRMNNEDLLTQIKDRRVELDKLDESALPKELRTLSTKERKTRVREAQKKRKATKKQIIELSTKRDAYLAKKRAEEGDKSELDGRLMKSLRKQAESIDVDY